MRSFPLTTIALLFCSLVAVSSHAQTLGSKPSKHAFGDVQIGDSETFSFLLTNIGTRTLRITSLSMTGAEFSFGTFQLPVKLNPGASVQLPVIFTPTRTGQSQGVSTIVSNDPHSPMALDLLGTGESGNSGKELQVSPSTLNFGNVTVGSTASLPATLSASGGPVTISSDKTNSSEFTITGLTLPVKIPSGGSVQATIQFTPNASGTAQAKAGFFSNAKDSPTFEQLTGTGVAQSQHQVDLTWDAGDGNAAGYNVFRGTTHGGPYDQINGTLVPSTSYTDSTVNGGTTYYYVATEVNNQGQQSGYSNETKAKIPKN